MPKLTIDHRDVEVPPGATLLEAARRLGIEIPTLCHLDGFRPSTSCMVCVVKVVGPDRLVPSCAAPAEDGMVVESETDEVRDARRAALELLLSDHPADCIAPCQGVCPARLDIPQMIRRIAVAHLPGAIQAARGALVLPATLGRICPAPCEKGCRRAGADGALSIRLLHRHAADADLTWGRSWLPDCRPATGRRVAVIGTGPAGLAAAWHLLQAGHAVTLFDDHAEPGGMLRYGVDEARLPRSVLDAEIALVARLGASFQMRVRVGRDLKMADLVSRFAAVLVACGKADEAVAHELGVAASPHGIAVDRQTFQTQAAGVFAAGDAVQARQMAVRSVAEGRAAAECISQFLAGAAPAAAPRPFTTRLGRPTEAEMAAMVAAASPEGRVVPSGGEGNGLEAEEARREARRCLRCDCRKADACRLRRWANALGAKPGRHGGTRRPFELHAEHAKIVYEPGKCIACGLCIQVAERSKEALGLTFIGRGFNVRVGVPFDETIAAGLKRAAADCVAACPTGAMAFKDKT